MFPFFLTLVGVMFKSIADMTTSGSTSQNAEFLNTFAMVVAVVATLIGVLLSVRKAEDAKAKLTVLGIHALIWIIGYFLVQLLVIVVIVAVVAAIFTGGEIFSPLLDFITSDRPSSSGRDMEAEDLERRREEIKQAVISKYGLHPSEVHVNSTADMVSINGEWKKVSDL